MELLNIKEDSINILWFPKTLSQDQIDHGGSNACTITSLLIALDWNNTERRVDISEDIIKFDTDEIATVLRMLKSAIVRGNEIYKTAIKDSPENVLNFTISESAAAIGSDMKMLFEWQTGIFMEDLGDSLHENLTRCFNIWEGSKPKSNHWTATLYIILTTKSNSILIVYQDYSRMVILIDTRSHLDKGAVIACAPQTELRALCRWYHSLLRKYFQEKPIIYELSFFYFNK